MICLKPGEMSGEESIERLIEIFGSQLTMWLLCNDLQTGAVSQNEFDWSYRMIRKYEHLDKPVN